MHRSPLRTSPAKSLGIPITSSTSATSRHAGRQSTIATLIPHEVSDSSFARRYHSYTSCLCCTLACESTSTISTGESKFMNIANPLQVRNGNGLNTNLPSSNAGISATRPLTLSMRLLDDTDQDSNSFVKQLAMCPVFLSSLKPDSLDRRSNHHLIGSASRFLKIWYLPYLTFFGVLPGI